MKNDQIKESKEETRVRLIKASWQNHAPDVVLGGLSYAEFCAGVEPTESTAERIRALIEELRIERGNLLAARANTRRYIACATNGAKAHKDFGPESALFRGMGYKGSQFHSSGLTRRQAGQAELIAS